MYIGICIGLLLLIILMIDCMDRYENFLFWNTPLENKRNMSYDLRGDVDIPYYYILPFNMSSTVPIKNKSIYEHY